MAVNGFVKRMNDYKKCMKVLNCANYVFLDEIDNFEFKKISKYNKSKNIYSRITHDFKVVNDFIESQDLLNAATILRTLYENIIYIIAKTYSNELNITLDTEPCRLRKVLENNCKNIFTDYFDRDDFNKIYKYLCKIVHPSSMKELVSYMSKTIKYKNYLLSNLKYIMLVIEYMYLNFLNKKIGNEESDFDLNFIDLCTYVNLINISCYINEVKDCESFIQKYFYYDTDNKYITDNNQDLKEAYSLLNSNQNLVEKNLNELISNFDKQISKSKYKENIDMILSNN